MNKNPSFQLKNPKINQIKPGRQEYEGDDSDIGGSTSPESTDISLSKFQELMLAEAWQAAVHRLQTVDTIQS